MPQLTPQQVRQFARLGAAARLAQLDAEIAAIKAVYPELAKGGAPAEPAAQKVAATPKRRRRYRMSPEARKAAAERMRKYWAERRAKQPARAQAATRKPRKKARPKRKRARRAKGATK
jgi:hypothetical protein